MTYNRYYRLHGAFLEFLVAVRIWMLVLIAASRSKLLFWEICIKFVHFHIVIIRIITHQSNGCLIFYIYEKRKRLHFPITIFVIRYSRIPQGKFSIYQCFKVTELGSRWKTLLVDAVKMDISTKTTVIESITAVLNISLIFSQLNELRSFL